MDGLRTVAVVLVIFYHLNKSLAPCGFLGVDIFFVISGFVVTGSVLSSSEASPLAAVARFWRRRILRIVPALLAMVLVSSAVAAMISPPFPKARYVAGLRTGLASIFGLGNFYLYRNASDYFNSDLSSNPFVHTWSLGVEEQFYFLFAVFFIGVLGYWKRQQSFIGLSAGVMATMGAMSYAAFLTIGKANPLIGYYFIPFRFWEIAAGSLLAYREFQFPNSLRLHRAVSLVIQTLALTCLAVSVWYDGYRGFPSTQISAAVASTALLILTGRAGTGFISRILSTPAFVWLGLLSYSLYLWHYPILFFWGTNIGLEHTLKPMLALLMVGIVAVLSYWTVERTFRHSSLPFSRVLLPWLAVIGGAGIAFIWLIQARPGIFYLGRPQLWRGDWFIGRDNGYFGKGLRPGSECELQDGSVVPTRLPETCVSASKSADTRATLLVIGDSHAYADSGMTEFAAQDGHYRLGSLPYIGCPVGEPESNKSVGCGRYWANMPAMLEDALKPNDVVLIAFFWPLYSDIATARAVETSEKIALAAKSKRAEVIVQAPMPVFERPAFVCTPEWFRIDYEGCFVERSEVARRRRFAMTKLQELAQTQGNVRIWDALPLLCPGKTCSPFREGKPLYCDQHHLAQFGSRFLGPFFLDFLRQR